MSMYTCDLYETAMDLKHRIMSHGSITIDKMNYHLADIYGETIQDAVLDLVKGQSRQSVYGYGITNISLKAYYWFMSDEKYDPDFPYFPFLHVAGVFNLDVEKARKEVKNYYMSINKMAA